ncbi:MAG: hypothetical protein A2V63_13360 [Candidatus Eisenbacteria bacterium RBG_19FT_COMBO_70_11]|nr:MAG: hypothetical protein A2V63_13360 [Candidatus Eisenbacteria bacterium RBG_19FT_COMBO_70_11]
MSSNGKRPHPPNTSIAFLATLAAEITLEEGPRLTISLRPQVGDELAHRLTAGLAALAGQTCLVTFHPMAARTQAPQQGSDDNYTA